VEEAAVEVVVDDLEEEMVFHLVVYAVMV